MSNEPAIAAVEAMESLLGVRICFHDFTGQLAGSVPGISLGHFSGCCLKIKDQHRAACLRFDAHMVRQRAAQLRVGFWKRCHAGFVECVVPLHVSGALAGILFAGPYTLPPGTPAPLDLFADGSPAGKTALPEAKRLRKGDRQAIRITLELLADRLVQALEQSEATPGDRRTRITAYLERSFRRPVTLADLARHLFVTESRTSQLLRELFGKPFPKLLNECRVQHARRLLAHTHWPIDAVSAECGYSDRHYFHRVFRRYTGTTPAAFRAQLPTPEARPEP